MSSRRKRKRRKRKNRKRRRRNRRRRNSRIFHLWLLKAGPWSRLHAPRGATETEKDRWLDL